MQFTLHGQLSALINLGMRSLNILNQKTSNYKLWLFSLKF